MIATSKPPVRAIKCCIRSTVAGMRSSDTLFGDSNNSLSVRFGLVLGTALGKSGMGTAISCDSNNDSTWFDSQKRSEILVEGLASGIPLTASPEGAVSRGTIGAKDERRRSDVQNMGAVDDLCCLDAKERVPRCS